jgi:cell fate regulator YaaT (PSP1 superfamily)
VSAPTHLVEVEFKGNRRAFYQWTGETPLAPKTPVIVAVERGEDLGRIHTTGELAAKRKAGTTHGKATPTELPKALRVAKPEEVDRAVRLRTDEHAVRKAAIEFARELKLDLKISDTEWQWDRRKLTAYFTAEDRVDFRELVRRLEKRFSTRVHMWHIGVRDEARRLDGIGRCGRQFCSASWLPELRPVKSSSAKDQRLSTLNPSQISGTCGRLMCCLRHEHEFYVAARRRFPKEGKVLTTLVGEEKVISNDIFRDQVTLRTAEGEARTIPLAQLRKETAPGAVPNDDEALALSGALIALERNARDQDDESPNDEPEEEQATTRIAAQLAVVAAPADNEAADSDDAAVTEGEEPLAAADGERKRRRRRGRRGGRRGRGGSATDGTSPPDNAPPDNAPPSDNTPPSDN